MSSYQYRDPNVKDKTSHDRLILNTGIPVSWKDGLYIETESSCLAPFGPNNQLWWWLQWQELTTLAELPKQVFVRFYICGWCAHGDQSAVDFGLEIRCMSASWIQSWHLISDTNMSEDEAGCLLPWKYDVTKTQFPRPQLAVHVVYH